MESMQESDVMLPSRGGMSGIYFRESGSTPYSNYKKKDIEEYVTLNTENLIIHHKKRKYVD